MRGELNKFLKRIKRFWILGKCIEISIIADVNDKSLKEELSGLHKV